MRSFGSGDGAGLLVAPRNGAEESAFQSWCDAALAWYGPRLGVGLVLALVLWWPTDALVFAGLPDAQAKMAEARLSLAALLAFASLVLPRVAAAQRRPLVGIGAFAILAAGIAGWYMAHAGQSDPYWFAFMYVVPVFSVALVTPLPGRVAVVVSMSAATVLGFLAGPGDAIHAPELPATISYLGFTTLLAIAIGHAVYLLVQTGFLMRLRVEEQRERLAELTRTLEQRVADQTRQLRILHGQSQEAGAEQRRLVARDLHDGLGQELSSLRLLVGLGRDITTEPAPRELFDELDGLVARVQISLRNVLEALRPRLLHEQGLNDALRGLLTETERRWGIRCVLELGELPSPMPPAASTALFRIAQEALHNVLRHAQASEVVVRVFRDDGFVQMEVEDDGRGIAADPSTGRGLEHIRERATELGGSASWTANGGTLVRVRLPLGAA